MQKSAHVQRQGNVACCPAPEIQKDTATRQGTMQGKRNVQPEQAVIRPFSQMAVVPDTFQQTIARYEVAEVAMDSAASGGSMKTASIRQPDIPETKRISCAEMEARFQASVAVAVQKLKKIEKDKLNGTFGVVPYCLEVVSTYRNLLQQTSSKFIKNPAGHVNNKKFLVQTMAPIYDAALNDALKRLQQDLAENRNAREQFKRIDRVATPARVLLGNFPGYRGYIKTLHNLFRHCIDNELLYLEYLSLKNSHSQYAVKASVAVIDWILSPGSTVTHLPLMSKEEKKEIEDKKNELLQNLDSRMKSRIAEEEKEKPDVLKDNMFRGVADTLAEMELFDKLEEEFKKMQEKCRCIPDDVQLCACLLREMTELCDCYDQSGIETSILCHRIQRLLSAVVRKILLSSEASCVDGGHSLDEALELIAHLMKSKNGWINNECRELYKSHAQPEKGLMGTTARTDKVAERYCDGLMTEIFEYIASEDETDHLCAAELLLKFMHNYGEGHELDTRHSLMARVRVAKDKLRYKLFAAIINEYNDHRKSKDDHGKISSAMSHHKSRFIKLIPHIHLLKNENTRIFWKHIAYCVWHHDIERLRHAETFSKEDVDTLLYMKHLAPMTKDYYKRYGNVIDAMKSFFRFTLRDRAAATFIEETLELLAWTDSLCQYYLIDELKSLSESWKQKYQGAASAKSMVSSGVLAEGMPAVTAHSAIVDTSMEASGCHLHMERQPALHMQPLTELVAAPALAVWKSSWQSVPVACCTPMIPPSAANSLQSTSAKHFSLDHHEMLTGEQWHFPIHPHAQGFPAACEYVQSQSYVVPQPQHSFQPITSAECGSGHPQASGGIIEQIERQINSLRTMRRNLSQVPIQGREYQQQLPLVWCPGVSLCYLDNNDAIAGILFLLTAVKLYLQQKASEPLDSKPEIPSLANPWSRYHSMFKEGADHLIEGMQQIIGSSMDRDTVYKLLIQLGDNGDKQVINKLFTNLKGKESVKENKAALQKLDIIHKLLLSVDILMKSR